MKFRERLAGFADKPDECWIWPGGCGNRHADGIGYGWTSLMIDGKRVTKWTHRLAYELLVGPIAEGMTVDHLCRVPRCMNPRHLEVVTRAENSRRMQAAIRREVCKYGHSLTGDNLVMDKGIRLCRECKRTRARKCYNRERATERARRYRARKRLEAQVQT